MRRVIERLITGLLVITLAVGFGVGNVNTVASPASNDTISPLDSILSRYAPVFADSLLKSVKVPNELEDYIAYNVWDFESEDLGRYTDSEILEDFVAVELYSHDRSDIVTQEINGSQTKVMRITHPAETVHDGFEMQVDLGQDFEEVYLSYNFKFGEEFNSTEGGKMPGLSGLPRLPWPFVVPVQGHGFWAINMFKPGGRMISYHRDRTTGWVPWSVEEYDHNPIYFINGCWYNITQRLVINTIENGVPQANGIKELWIDGRMVFRIDNLKMMQDDTPTMKIDALLLSNFYGGDPDYYKPNTECYAYIDNIVVYMPTDDPVTGRTTHSPSTIIETPNVITDRRVHYDYLITNEGRLTNQEYGTTYSGCIDEAYLIDAGEGNTASLSLDFYQLGSKDFIFIYDGNTTDSELLKFRVGYTTGSKEIVESSGRYLFLRFSTNKDDHALGFEATVSMSQGVADIEAPSVPTGLQATSVNVSSINLSWNASVDNRAVTGYRVYLGGSLDGSTTTTNYSLTQLNAETSYEIAISSFDAASNESPRSPVINVTTLAADVEAPSVPTGLEVTSISGNSLSIRWTPSTDNVAVTGYNIFVDGTLDGSSFDETYAVSGLNSNTSYTLTVSAFDGVPNESAQSASIVGTTGAPDDEAPSVPTGLTSVNITSNSISLEWNSSTDNILVTGYHVFANGLLKGTAFSNAYTITQLNPGITYNISVSAFDASNNESTKSPEIVRKTINPDNTLDPTLPEVRTLEVKKSTTSVTTKSELTDLGHTELQDYGILYSKIRDQLESGNVVYGSQENDSVAHMDRVEQDPVLFYDFSSGRGNQVVDRSGGSEDFNLTINKPLNTYWLPGQGLRISGNTLIYGDASPSSLYNEFSSSNEITIETWIKPASLNQSGPVRIFTLSSGSDSRAFSLMQEGNVSEFEYVIRLNTSLTDENGLPELTTDNDFFTLGLHHVVYTRNSKGEEYLYVNGVEKVSGERLGDLGLWSDTYRLAFGNELNEERQWNGTVYLAAVYNRALDRLDVLQNYDAGFGNVRYTANLESLETNTSYYMSPFVRTDQGIVYGAVREIMIQNVLDFGGNDTLQIAVVPNPSNGNFVLSFEDANNVETTATIRIADMSGQIIYTDDVDLGSELASFEKAYNLSDIMRSGIYSVMLILGSNSKAQRLIIN